MWGKYEPLLGFWGKAPAAKRLSGYYRGLRERWMRESCCYGYMFFCHTHTPKKWGYGTPTPPLQKVGVRVTPVSYGYAGKGKVKHLASKYHSGHRGLFLAIRCDVMARASAWQRKV